MNVTEKCQQKKRITPAKTKRQKKTKSGYDQPIAKMTGPSKLTNQTSWTSMLDAKAKPIYLLPTRKASYQKRYAESESERIKKYIPG